MWFHNNAKNEMLMGIIGLSKMQATLDFIFPERKMSEEDLKSLGFNYSDHKIGRLLDFPSMDADLTNPSNTEASWLILLLYSLFFHLLLDLHTVSHLQQS
jgi:hypothetical protein